MAKPRLSEPITGLRKPSFHAFSKISSVKRSFSPSEWKAISTVHLSFRHCAIWRKNSSRLASCRMKSPAPNSPRGFSWQAPP